MRGRTSAIANNGVAIAGGPEDFRLLTCQLLLDDEPVTDGSMVAVDPLVDHYLGMSFDIANDSPGFNILEPPPGDWWRVCTTVYNETDRTTVGFDSVDRRAYGGSGGTKIKVGKITKPITFRVKLWANQALAAPPDSAYW